MKINDENRNKIFSAIKILHFMLQKISDNRAKDMENEINQLFDKTGNALTINDVIKNSIGRTNF